jgi:hypothetical protein
MAWHASRPGTLPCWQAPVLQRLLRDSVGTARTRDAAQALTVLALRALGVVDARARGLVVQTPLPTPEDAAA